MLANTILIYSLFLVGAASILGILIMVIIINGKLNKLTQKISEENKNQENKNQENKNQKNVNWNNLESNSYYTYNENDLTNQSKLFHNTVNIMAYRSEADTQASAMREEELIRKKVKVFQENENYKADMQRSKSAVGIVFCRNCASQFTSDKDSCPVCGAKRR